MIALELGRWTPSNSTADTIVEAKGYEIECLERGYEVYKVLWVTFKLPTFYISSDFFRAIFGTTQLILYASNLPNVKALR